LEDEIEIISGGTPKTNKLEYWNGNIPWLTIADFNNVNKYVDKAQKTITEIGLSESSTKLLKPGDIIISARGTIGAIAVVNKEMAFNQSCYGIRSKSNGIYQDFLYYLLKNSINMLLKNSYGAVFDTITRETFSLLFCPLPPLPEQKAIAEVLSSIDDKIELLHRQNKTLEEMAMTLFRQWFIEPTKDGLPEGWEEVELYKLGQIICGKIPPKNKPEYFGGKIPFIKIPDMHENVFVFKTEDGLSEIGAKTQKNKTLPERSICVSCIATVGLVSMNAFVSQTNQQINSIIPYKEFYRYFLYLKMKSMNEELIAMASGGTATLNLNTTEFSKIKIEMPKDDYLHVFHEKIKHIFEKIFINTSQIQTLEKLRDTLLPKLMSGEIRVRT
jgi:type I restriction enzyme S subunit